MIHSPFAHRFAHDLPAQTGGANTSPSARRLCEMCQRPGKARSEAENLLRRSERGRPGAARATDAGLGYGMMNVMELRPGLRVDDLTLAQFAVRHGVRRLALYGSALREDFNSASDIDMLVEFHPGQAPGLIELAQMELELEARLGRSVELRTYEDLSPYFRDKVAETARQLYAA